MNPIFLTALMAAQQNMLTTTQLLSSKNRIHEMEEEQKYNQERYEEFEKEIYIPKHHAKKDEEIISI